MRCTRWALWAVIWSVLGLPSLGGAAGTLTNAAGGSGGGSASIEGDTTVPSTCTPLTGPNALFLDTDDETFHVCTNTDTMTQIGGAEADTLATVTGRGNTSTGNDETNPFEILGTGGEAANGWSIDRTSTGESRMRCKETAGLNKCNYYREVDSGFFGGFTTGGTPNFRYDASTGAITKMTVDFTSADIAATRKIVVPIKLASCPGGTASGALDRPGNGATVPTPTCLDAGSVEAPHLAFSGTAVNSGSYTVPVPPQFTSLTSMNATVRYATASASPSGNVQWDMSTVCRAVGETIDGTFNTAQNVVDAVAAQNVKNDATQTGVTITGCAPNEDLTFLLSRNGASGSDTNDDVAMAFFLIFEFIGVE